MATELTADQKSKVFIESFRKQGYMINMIINNNKDNELFRMAWKELINESTVEFERKRLKRYW